MVDAWVICALSFISALHMLYTGMNKHDIVMRWRWCFTAVPFLMWTVIYAWIWLLNPPVEVYRPWARNSIFCLLLLSALYFIVDLITDYITKWRLKHG